MTTSHGSRWAPFCSECDCNNYGRDETEVARPLHAYLVGGEVRRVLAMARHAPSPEEHATHIAEAVRSLIARRVQQQALVVDLVDALLQRDPMKRPTAAEALEHELFATDKKRSRTMRADAIKGKLLNKHL